VRFFENRWNLALLLLLALAVARLWIQQIGSGFWVDEMVTVFVIHHGVADRSLAVAPQVPQSVYYPVAHLADRLFGTREAAYRLPSILFSLIALWLIARLAIRLIHPEAGWFAVFACLALKAFNWEAADARPYAMGFCALAAAMLFLVRWLDSGSAWDAAAFLVLAALVWRIQLIFWPVYAVLVLYTVVRLARRETVVTWSRAALLFTALGVLLAPVLLEAIVVNRGAHDHVIAAEPTVRDLLNAVRWKLIVLCAAGAWLIARLSKWTRERVPLLPSAMALIGGWWLIPPVALFAFSLASGNSVFVRRYYSIAMPGAALAATFLTARFLPKPHWKHAAALLGAGVLVMYGARPEPWPGSDWRSAAAAVNALPAGTPVIAPSPFVEAKSPAWRPDYPLPGFLYAHLNVYPLRQRTFLFPFQPSAEAEQYAAELDRKALARSHRFVIYGGDSNVRFWRNWFAKQPELAGWSAHSLGSFGDVGAVLFETNPSPR